MFDRQAHVSRLASSFERDENAVLVHFDDRMTSFSHAELSVLAAALARNCNLLSLSARDTLGGLGGSGSEILLGQLTSRQSELARLDWYGNSAGESCINAVLQLSDKCTALKFLDLGLNGLWEEEGQRIAQMIKRVPSLTHLGLAKNDLCVKGMKDVLEALHDHRALTSLDISENCLMCRKGNAAVIVGSFFKSVCGRRLRTFSAARDCFGVTGLSEVARALNENTSLTWLDVSDNYNDYEVSGQDAYEELVEWLSNANYALLHIEPAHVAPIQRFCERNQLLRNVLFAMLSHCYR